MRHKTRAFTMVEIMIVVLIIGVLVAIAVPQWVSARESSRRSSCLSNLRMIDNGKEMFALENRRGIGDAIDQTDLVPDYIKTTFPTCPAGGTYDIQVVGTPASCTIHRP